VTPSPRQQRAAVREASGGPSALWFARLYNSVSDYERLAGAL
jgi:hypothetical protein